MSATRRTVVRMVWYYRPVVSACRSRAVFPERKQHAALEHEPFGKSCLREPGEEALQNVKLDQLIDWAPVLAALPAEASGPGGHGRAGPGRRRARLDTRRPPRCRAAAGHRHPVRNGPGPRCPSRPDPAGRAGLRAGSPYAEIIEPYSRMSDPNVNMEASEV